MVLSFSEGHFNMFLCEGANFKLITCELIDCYSSAMSHSGPNIRISVLGQLNQLKSNTHLHWFHVSAFSRHVCCVCVCVTHKEISIAGLVLAGPSVVELSICDFKAWLMDADLAPCSLLVPFSIYQRGDVSWFSPVPLPLHACRVEHHGAPCPVASRCNQFEHSRG